MRAPPRLKSGWRDEAKRCSSEHERGTFVLGYCLIATAFGPVGLAWSALGLVRLQLPDDTAALTRARLLSGIEAAEGHPSDALTDGVGKLQRYFAGVPTDFSAVPLDLSGVLPFPRRLYEEMLTLRWGETLTYGELAGRVGAAGAAQAVGQAMGANPIPVIIPCHRVLASQNKLGGFSAPGGGRTKLRLLEMEGIRLGTRDPAQMELAL
jgi:methylated-DNA-[protein]-cysteine S-methyltransferase